MSDEITKSTHFRLLPALKAIGPYLREPQSEDGHYLFDCLSVCVNDKKSPEEREFWCWWLDLERTDEGFAAKYHIGKYNQAGDWVCDKVPKKAHAEINRTQENFHAKLVETLATKFDLEVTIHADSAEFV